MIISAILTARKNSNLKDKNLRKVNNKPCVYYPIKAAKSIRQIKYFYVSSDCKKLLKYSSGYGYEKILRPKNLALSNTAHKDVISHALNFMKKKKIIPDIVLILLGNAPIIKSSWISKAIRLMKKSKCSAVVPVIEDNDKHPMRAKKIVNGYLKGYFNKKKIPTNRQELDKNYFLCHNFWLINVKDFYKNNGEAPWNFMGKKVKGYVVDKSIDIHKFEDIIMAKHILKN